MVVLDVKGLYWSSLHKVVAGVVCQQVSIVQSSLYSRRRGTRWLARVRRLVARTMSLVANTKILFHDVTVYFRLLVASQKMKPN